MMNKIKKIIFREFWWIFARYTPYKWYLRWVLDSIQVQGNAYANQRIFCVRRDFFDKDFEQLSYRLRDYGWIWFEKGLFKIFLEDLIPEYARGQKKYSDFLNDKNVHWDKAIAKARVLIRVLKDKKGLACLVTANIDYYQDYALKMACKLEGVPVVVMQKEYPITEKVGINFTKHYMGWNSTADVVAVAGERGRDCLVAAGVDQYSKIVVTGFPRLDRYRSIDAATNTAKSQITILSFRAGYGDNSEVVFFELVNQLIDRVSGQTPLLIKAKNESDTRIISERISTKIRESKGSQVTVLHQIPLFDAFTISSVVVGYNSLSVVEALLSGAHILIPAYASGDVGMLTEAQCQGCAVTFCLTQDELLAKIDEAREGRLPPLTKQELAARKQVFASYWKWDEAISASERFGEVLESVLNK